MFTGKANLMNRKREEFIHSSSLMDSCLPVCLGLTEFSRITSCHPHTSSVCLAGEAGLSSFWLNVEISAHRGANDHLVGTGNHFLPRRFSPPPQQPHPSLWTATSWLHITEKISRTPKVGCNLRPYLFLLGFFFLLLIALIVR